MILSLAWSNLASANSLLCFDEVNEYDRFIEIKLNSPS